MTFSERLLHLRRREGFSQEELAERLAVSRQAVSRWELGTAMPDAFNLLQLARLFGVTVDFLLCGGEEAVLPTPVSSGRPRLNAASAALFAVLAAQAALYLLGILGWTVWDSSYRSVSLPALAQLLLACGFEVFLRASRHAVSVPAGYRRLYGHALIWLTAYTPLRLATVFIFFRIRPSMHHSVAAPWTATGLYFALCAAVTLLYARTARKEKQTRRPAERHRRTYAAEKSKKQ